LLTSNRSDLLAYLQEYARDSRRSVSKLDHWRRRRWSRRQVATKAEAVAAELGRFGVGPDARVGLRAADGPLWLAAFFGILRAGAIAVPIDATYSDQMARNLGSSLDLKGWVQDTGASLAPADVPVVTLDAHRSHEATGSVAPPPPWPHDDPERFAEVVLTSGTTGDPQSVPVTHSNLRTVLDGLQAEIGKYQWALRVAPSLHIAVALPLSHLYGQVMGAFLPVLLSANVSFVATMPPAHLAGALRRHSAWVLATVPHTLAKLGDHLLEVGSGIWGKEAMQQRLDDARGLSWPRRWILFDRVRRQLGRRFIAVVSGGAELDRTTEELWSRLGYLVIQGYGLTEAAPLVALNHPLRPSAGSVGKPLPGIEVKLGESGEILVRGGNVTTARGPRTRVDDEGWLHTGDLGELDESGSVRFVGRRADRVVTAAGVNIDLEAVAAALRRHPSVVEAIVTESPRGEKGAICAVLALRPDCDAREAVQAANEQLPDAARLRRWFVWPAPDLPRTPTGKPRRGAILEWLREQFEVDSAATSARQKGASNEDLLKQHVARISGLDLDATDSAAPLGELLDSLQRVELAAYLEQSFGLNPTSELFSGDASISELASARKASPTSSRPLPEPAAAPGAGPPPAEWRFWPMTRVLRWLLREGVVRPALSGCVRVRSMGLANLETSEPPFLLACNHVSILDPLVLLQAMPRGLRHRVAPAAMWQHFIEHRSGRAHYFWGVLGLNLFPLVQVGDWRPSLRIAGRLADRGYCPLIYPEGRRSGDGHLLDFQLGVTVLSAELQLPIVPCATAGLHAVMPVACKWPRRDGLWRPTVAVCFGAPIPALGPRADRVAAAHMLHDRVAELQRRALAVSGRA
jgi:long-chain acyl-CoA synthetase